MVTLKNQVDRFDLALHVPHGAVFSIGKKDNMRLLDCLNSKPNSPWHLSHSDKEIALLKLLSTLS